MHQMHENLIIYHKTSTSLKINRMIKQEIKTIEIKKKLISAKKKTQSSENVSNSANRKIRKQATEMGVYGLYAWLICAPGSG